MKRCSRCSVEKEISKFGKSKSRADGHSYWCKECTKKYYEENSHVYESRKKREVKIGSIFGRIKIIQFLDSHNGNRIVLGECECGTVKSYKLSALRNGLTRSCGCYQRESVGSRVRTHGLTKHPLYATWTSMKERCSPVSGNGIYARKGTCVCKEWERSFTDFYEWSISSGWKQGLTIDRINNDGNYEPSNCRWSTRFEQMNNTSKNMWIEYNGETHTATEWARSIGVKPYIIWHRIRRGWDAERALTQPVKIKERRIS